MEVQVDEVSGVSTNGGEGMRGSRSSTGEARPSGIGICGVMGCPSGSEADEERDSESCEESEFDPTG